MDLIRADASPLTVDDFDARFERARPRVLAVARSILGAEGADDIVQDTYLAARSRIDQNLCYQVLRRSALQDRHQARFADPPPVSDPALRDLIERLPLRERAIVVLHYAHGYSLEEVARMLSLSYPNTRAVLSRTRRRMYRQWSGVDR